MTDETNHRKCISLRRLDKEVKWCNYRMRVMARNVAAE